MSELLIGVIIGSVGPILITFINQYFQSKREKESLIFDLSKIYWQEALIQARQSHEPSSVYPLESFIISIKFLFEKILTKNFDSKNIKNILEEHSKLVKTVNEYYDKK